MNRDSSVTVMTGYGLTVEVRGRNISPRMHMQAKSWASRPTTRGIAV
jgi:hypothetical protein